MKKLFYFAAMLFSLAAVSCEGLSLEPGKGPDEGDEEKALISFAKAEVGEDFPQMELLFGLTIGEPVNVSNVKLTADEDGNITPERELYWGEGQKTASTFTAYFPYDASYTDKAVNVFSVREDQSSEEKFILSNLMTATTSASPSTKAVAMNFKNRMAGLDMYFDNRTGKTIKEVYVSSVYSAVNLNIVNGECVTIQNNPVDIKMLYVTTTAKGLDLYNAIIPVQTSNLTLNVVYTDGSSQSCSLPDVIALEAKVYSTDENPIILAKDAIEATFSVTVSDWANGGSFSFLKEEDEYTMQIEISEITYKSFKAAFTPSDKEVYYIFAAYSKSYLDELLKTYTLESLILERIETYRPYYEPNYGIEELMSLLCYKGDFYTTFVNVPAETEISVLAAFFDAHGNLISRCFREDSKTLQAPPADEAYAALLGTYKLPVLDYFNYDAPFEASVVIEEDEINETFVFSMPDLSPDTYLAVYNAETGTLKLTNSQIGLNGYTWNFGGDYVNCGVKLDMFLWNTDQAVDDITLSPNQDGSVLTLSSSPAVPAQDTLCLSSFVLRNDEVTGVGYYSVFKVPGNTLTEVAPAKAVSEKGLTSFKTKETGILPKRNMKGAKIHKELR